MKEFTIVESISRSIVWVESSDRYILIVREKDEIYGINFMQGDDLEYFKERYNKPDPKLTKFVKAVVDKLKGDTELDRIDSAIWAYFEYMDNFWC
jgi:hypothetical protein